MSIRLNDVVNKENDIQFYRMVEELVNVQLFFDYFQKYFDKIKKLEKYVLKREKKILNFNQRDGTILNKWVADYSSTSQFLQVAFEEALIEKETTINELQLVDKAIQTDDREQNQ